MADVSCTNCDKFAAYTCIKCGDEYCGDHIDDHKETFDSAS